MTCSQPGCQRSVIGPNWHVCHDHLLARLRAAWRAK